MHKKKFWLKIVLLAAMVLLPLGCEEGIDTIIPEVNFRYAVNLTQHPYSLMGIGTSAIIQDPLRFPSPGDVPIGYAGVIIYKASETTFYAFDRCCPYHVEEKHQVNPDGALAVCPVDSSKFVLADGLAFPVSGPAEYGLKTYNTSVDKQILYIYN